MMFSDDGGQKWQIGRPIQAGGNECQVIDRADGSLLVNTRMQGNFEGYRGVATSSDGGNTWSAIRQEKLLPCPRCQGSLFQTGSGKVLFSNPDPGSPVGGKPKGDRIHLTVRLSHDGGHTWPVARRLHTGPSAYSSLAELPGGTILCLYEGGQTNFRETLTLARFDLGWLASSPGTAKP
jgi:sialidase-1